MPRTTANHQKTGKKEENPRQSRRHRKMQIKKMQRTRLRTLHRV